MVLVCCTVCCHKFWAQLSVVLKETLAEMLRKGSQSCLKVSAPSGKAFLRCARDQNLGAFQCRGGAVIRIHTSWLGLSTTTTTTLVSLIWASLLSTSRPKNDKQGIKICLVDFSCNFGRKWSTSVSKLVWPTECRESGNGWRVECRHLLRLFLRICRDSHFSAQIWRSK